MWEGWEGPGFLSAADRAKSPLWEGWEGPGFLSAADRAKSLLWEGWEGPGCLSAADRQKRLCGRAVKSQVSYPPRVGQMARFPIRRG